MKIEKINATNYADIFGLYDKNGKPIGTMEVVLAGQHVGRYFYTWSSATRAQVKKWFIETIGKNGGLYK